MVKYSINQLLDALKEKNYQVFTKPYMLNIVGVRTTEQPNKFDDTMNVFWKDDNNKWILKQYPCTTDPGTYWLKKPMNKLGTAILKEGQYIDGYKVGLHKGKYTALRQAKNVVVYRDSDRNAIFDFNSRETTGMYGINIHKAGLKSEYVNNWSAGCQVFQKSADFDEFMGLVKKQEAKYGNKFTYTLVDKVGTEKKKKFRVGLYIGITATICILLGYVAFVKLYKK
jgi:hypothetical protein